MSENRTIGRVALYVEVDGKATLVTMPQDQLRELVHLAATMCGGVLPVSEQEGVEFCVKGVHLPKWTVADNDRQQQKETIK